MIVSQSDPGQSYNFRNLKENEVLQWVASDLDEIVNILQQSKISLVVQNYPMDFSVNFILSRISGKFKLLFVDIYSIFQEKMANGIDQRDLFVLDGHCNAKGYGITAENDYKRIQAEGLLK